MWRRAAAMIVVASMVGCTDRPQPASAPCPASPFRHSPPLVIAHAGGEGLGPANTIVAMQRSLAAGANVLDADLRMTSDGVIVARHDRDLAATTDGSGFVDEHTWDELQALDTRVSWHGDPIDQPVRIPSLEQILATFPDVTISLEIKQTTPSIAVPLCDLLRRADATGRVYLSANDDSAVYEAQSQCPKSAIITTTYKDVAAMRVARSTDMAWCAPAPIGQPPYRAGRLDADDVQWAHDHGMAIFTWTVDDPDTLRDLARAGVDGVYTRRPDLAAKVFAELTSGGR